MEPRREIQTKNNLSEEDRLLQQERVSPIIRPQKQTNHSVSTKEEERQRQGTTYQRRTLPEGP